MISSLSIHTDDGGESALPMIVVPLLCWQPVWIDHIRVIPQQKIEPFWSHPQTAHITRGHQSHAKSDYDSRVEPGRWSCMIFFLDSFQVSKGPDPLWISLNELQRITMRSGFKLFQLQVAGLLFGHAKFRYTNSLAHTNHPTGWNLARDDPSGHCPKPGRGYDEKSELSGFTAMWLVDQSGWDNHW